MLILTGVIVTFHITYTSSSPNQLEIRDLGSDGIISVYSH